MVEWYNCRMASNGRMVHLSIGFTNGFEWPNGVEWWNGSFVQRCQMVEWFNCPMVQNGGMVQF